MNTSILSKIGLTDNEIKIYLLLLKVGSSSAYEISQKSGIYRVHVYDKLEQLMDKGVVTQVREGTKKVFQATPPEKLKRYLEDKRRQLDLQEQELDEVLPKLLEISQTPHDDVEVEVFKGIEGLKYVLKDIIKTKKDLIMTGLEEAQYHEALSIFMQQYFRDLAQHGIKERVITSKKSRVIFPKEMAKTTSYRYLEAKDLNPANTIVYGDKVVTVVWGTPVTAIVVKNKQVADTHREHFEHLWKMAAK